MQPQHTAAARQCPLEMRSGHCAREMQLARKRSSSFLDAIGEQRQHREVRIYQGDVQVDRLDVIHAYPQRIDRHGPGDLHFVPVLLHESLLKEEEPVPVVRLQDHAVERCAPHHAVRDGRRETGHRIGKITAELQRKLQLAVHRPPPAGQRLQQAEAQTLAADLKLTGPTEVDATCANHTALLGGDGQRAQRDRIPGQCRVDGGMADGMVARHAVGELCGQDGGGVADSAAHADLTIYHPVQRKGRPDPKESQQR